MNSIKKIVISHLLILCWNFNSVKAQEPLVLQNNFGFNAGLNLAIGTHIQRAGLNFNFFYVYQNFQANSELRAYFNFRNLGPRGFHPELVLSQGLLYAYGNRSVYFNPFLNSVSNQTGYLNSFAYSYNAYFNNKKTKQVTGILSIEVNRISLISENDILAHTYFDRFRTAAVLLQYQFEDKWQAAINCTMWTGQYFKKKTSERKEFKRACFMDTVSGVYTNFSHGLLSAQFKFHLGYSQIVQANVGVDAEQVRNVIQNKFIHDMPFIPKKWNKTNNCHIPMLDDKGGPFIYSEGQKLRRPKLYLNVLSNANLFY